MFYTASGFSFVNPGFGNGCHPDPLRIARDEDNQHVALIMNSFRGALILDNVNFDQLV